MVTLTYIDSLVYFFLHTEYKLSAFSAMMIELYQSSVYYKEINSDPK